MKPLFSFIILGTFCLLLTIPAFTDVVVFMAGNSLSGHVEKSNGSLQLTLDLGGATVIDPAQIKTIQYQFTLVEGDAHPDYLALAETLRKNQSFIELQRELKPFLDEDKPLSPEIQSKVDQFVMQNSMLLNQLVQATRKTLCGREYYLLYQAPPDAILEDTKQVYQVLPDLNTLHAIYTLASPTAISGEMASERAFAGLRLANHWQKSIPSEVELALGGIAARSIRILESEKPENAVEAWNRSQDFLRFHSVAKFVKPRESLELAFKLYEKAFKERGIEIPEQFDPKQAEAWVKLLAAEVSYAHRLATAQGKKLAPELEKEYSARLIALLEPNWTIEKHPQFRDLHLQHLAIRGSLGEVLSEECKILIGAGFSSTEGDFNPLNQILDNENKVHLFSSVEK